MIGNLSFPEIPPDQFSRRAGTATKWIGKWIRRKGCGYPPSFRSELFLPASVHLGMPIIGIDRETRDAPIGHSDGSVSREYGEFYL